MEAPVCVCVCVCVCVERTQHRALGAQDHHAVTTPLPLYQPNVLNPFSFSVREARAEMSEREMREMAAMSERESVTKEQLGMILHGYVYETPGN